jgi:hypothetical protein
MPYRLTELTAFPMFSLITDGRNLGVISTTIWKRVLDTAPPTIKKA